MSVLARIDAVPELATFPPVSRTILAHALEDGHSLRPVSFEADREILLRAEHLLRREGMPSRDALARARGERISTPTLRGVLRYAASLLEHSDVTVPGLTRRQVVDEALRLFARNPVPPVEIDVDAFKEALDATEAAVELYEPGDPLGEVWGPILGTCARCGDVVRAGDEGHPVTVAVFTWKGRTRTWRLVAPATDLTPTGMPKKIVHALLEGEEPMLCMACAVRWSAGLLANSDLPDVDDINGGLEESDRLASLELTHMMVDRGLEGRPDLEEERRQKTAPSTRGLGMSLEACLAPTHPAERRQ